MIAYHFVGKRLRDGRPVPKNGELLRFDGEPLLCTQGLHASLDPFDALQYAPGPNLCKVECGGTIVHGADKLACTERTIIARFDATVMLRYFARMRALSVVDKWDAPYAVLDYLMTGNESKRSAARAAAGAAAWDAAGDAARAAVWAAARAAAGAAAWDAARAAAGAAARNEFNALVAESFEVVS